MRSDWFSSFLLSNYTWVAQNFLRSVYPGVWNCFKNEGDIKINLNVINMGQKQLKRNAYMYEDGQEVRKKLQL